MATMTFTVPDDVKEAFERAFAGEDLSKAAGAALMRAVEERDSGTEAAARRREAVEAILKGGS
ncbi:MAG: hypothetical protein R3D33_01465 [Hyphomicrobiaceae bacterium]